MNTVGALASELLARLPAVAGEERRLGLEVYRQLAQGEPVLTSALARALHVSVDTVDELLGHPNLQCLTYLDDQKRIIGFGGLAIREMPHQFKVDGRTLYTWCAWDSLFIPGILGLEAEVESPAPASAIRIRLRVGPDGVNWVQPQSAVMSFLLPSAQTFQGDVLKAMASFCHYIFFFPDRNTAAAWTRSHPDTAVISVSDAFELGRQMVAAVASWAVEKRLTSAGPRPVEVWQESLPLRLRHRTLLVLLAPPVRGQAPRLVHIQCRDDEQHQQSEAGMQEVAPKPAEVGRVCLSRSLRHHAHGRHVQQEDGGGKDGESERNQDPIMAE